MDVRVWDGGPLVVGYHVRFGQEVISSVTGVIRYGQLTLYLNLLFLTPVEMDDSLCAIVFGHI